MTPSTGPLLLLADIQVGVMMRSLAIAAVLAAPIGAVLWRRHAARRARQAERVPAGEHPTTTGPPTLEALVEEIDRLGEHTSGADDTVPVTVTVPDGLTIDGDEAPAAVVDAIVRDALARSGLAPTAELDAGGVRVIECRRVR